MEQMIIMMNCSINIMDIGNKAIILLCDPKDDKMFPFHHEEGSCRAPVGNITLIEYWLEIVKKLQLKDLYIVAKATPYIKELAQTYDAKIINYDDEMFANISQIDKDCILVEANTFGSLEDLISVVNQEEDAIIVAPWKEQAKAFAIKETTAYIQEIYAHPRDHYADYQVYGICKIAKEGIKKLTFVKKGSYTINCGQMPDDEFHLISAIDQLIKKGLRCKPVIAKNKLITVMYPWDILAMNEQYCQNMELICDDIDPTAKLIYVKRNKDHYIHVGKNVCLENVTIEGNCWIDDDVIIKDGAYLGNNCIIGKGSKITNHCLIHENTVIGPKNKIGFGAEICGVTMEGVAMVHTCEVYGVIGRYVDIAAGVIMAILRFDDAQVSRKVQGLNIRSRYTNAICIGDYVRTGVNNVFFPGVSVGTKSALGPGLIIDKDIPANSLILVKQEKNIKEWGSNKYGW